MNYQAVCYMSAHSNLGALNLLGYNTNLCLVQWQYWRVSVCAAAGDLLFVRLLEIFCLCGYWSCLVQWQYWRALVVRLLERFCLCGCWSCLVQWQYWRVSVCVAAGEFLFVRLLELLGAVTILESFCLCGCWRVSVCAAAGEVLFVQLLELLGAVTILESFGCAATGVAWCSDNTGEFLFVWLLKSFCLCGCWSCMFSQVHFITGNAITIGLSPRSLSLLFMAVFGGLTGDSLATLATTCPDFEELAALL